MLLSDQIRAGDSVLDVGCGGGHYLRSMQRLIQVPFSYVGVDPTEDYLEAAKQAWNDTPDVTFRICHPPGHFELLLERPHC